MPIEVEGKGQENQEIIDVRENDIVSVNTKAMDEINHRLDNQPLGKIAKAKLALKETALNIELMDIAFNTKEMEIKTLYEEKQIKEQMKREETIANQQEQHAILTERLAPKREMTRTIEKQEKQSIKTENKISKIFIYASLFVFFISSCLSVAGVLSSFEIRSITIPIIFFALLIFSIQTILFLASAFETTLKCKNGKDFSGLYIAKWVFYIISVYGTYEFLLLVMPPKDSTGRYMIIALAGVADWISYVTARLGVNMYYKNSNEIARNFLKSLTENLSSIKSRATTKVNDLKSKNKNVKEEEKIEAEIEKVNKDIYGYTAPIEEVTVTSPTETLEKKLRQAKEKTPSKLKHKECVAGRKRKDIDNIYDNVIEKINLIENKKAKITSKKLGMNISPYYWNQIKDLLIENGICYKNDEGLFKL